MIRIVLTVLSVLSLFFVSESARILAVYPAPSFSHHLLFRTLTNDLVRRGHEVVVITTDPEFPKGESPANLTEIDVHDVSYKLWNEIMYSTSRGSRNLHEQVSLFLRLVGDIFEAQILTDDVKKLTQDKNQKFDLLLLEAFITPTLIFSHIFKAPVIQISSFCSVRGDYETIGAPTHPILYPELSNQRLYNLSIWEKLSEIFKWILFKNLYYIFEVRDDEMLKRNFGANVPDLDELKNNVDMLFLNMHPIWEDNRPVPPGVVYIGGIYQQVPKELPKELKSYLDESKNGVIYVNLGANVNTSLLPPDKAQIIVKVLSKLPYDILLRWNTEINTYSHNIRISRWLPQADLLRHPNVKLFITQGGQQSTEESIMAGVPLIGIPMLGDQWFNVEKYVKLKIGLRIDMEAITDESLEDAIKTVVNDKSYRQNVLRLRSIMRDQPQSALERAVWWVEHVLRHGGARHLRAPAANISWVQYLELELVIVILALLLSAIIAFVATIYFGWMYWEYSANEKLKQS